MYQNALRLKITTVTSTHSFPQTSKKLSKLTAILRCVAVFETIDRSILRRLALKWLNKWHSILIVAVIFCQRFESPS